MTKLDNLRKRAHRAGGSPRAWASATVLARLALATGFLSAVADRFGLWGKPGSGNVGWGTYDLYLAYVHELAPYLPGGFVDAVGGVATAVEATLGIALLLGVAVRLSAWASTGVLLTFALSMFLFSHPEAPFSASVFSAAALALLLALAPTGAYALALDRKLGLERSHSGSLPRPQTCTCRTATAPEQGQ
ncbi:DoxX family protein [Streptomyces albospinus]|nr:DoxX family protein [Streptomyces albospinus]